MCVCVCAIHQNGYAKFSGVKYVLFVCKMHLHFSYSFFFSLFYFRFLWSSNNSSSTYSKLHLSNSFFFSLSLKLIWIETRSVARYLIFVRFQIHSSFVCALREWRINGYIFFFLFTCNAASFSFDYFISYSFRFVSRQAWHLISFCHTKEKYTRINSFTHSHRICCMYFCWAWNIRRIKTVLNSTITSVDESHCTNISELSMECVLTAQHECGTNRRVWEKSERERERDRVQARVCTSARCMPSHIFEWICIHDYDSQFEMCQI